MSTQNEFADHVGISQQAVAELIRRGTIPKGAGRGGLDLDACRIAYIEHLREVAAGRLGESAGGLDLVSERARLAKAQADAQELKNLVAESKVCEWADAVALFGADLAMIRSRFLAMPSAMAARLFQAKTPAELQAKLYDAVCDVLSQLCSPERYAAQAASKPSASAIPEADTDIAPTTSTQPERH
jgi:phage terminase Nu1 subunit (DNA packaging protein)